MKDADPYARYISKNMFDRRERVERNTRGYRGTGRKGRPVSWTHLVPMVQRIALETASENAQQLGGVGHARPAVFISHFEVVDRRGHPYEFESANSLNAFMQSARKASANTHVIGPNGRSQLRFAISGTVRVNTLSGRTSYGVGPSTEIYWWLAPIRSPPPGNPAAPADD